MPVWRGVENLAPPGFDPWTIQPVACCYTICAILAYMLTGTVSSSPPPFPSPPPSPSSFPSPPPPPFSPPCPPPSPPPPLK